MRIKRIATFVLAASALFSVASIHASRAMAQYTPAQVQSAYSMNNIVGGLGGSVIGNGAGQTIAIVDPYNYTQAYSDLNYFSTYFGLPSFNLAGGSSSTPGLPTFTQDLLTNTVDGTGVSQLETALDIEWAHVMAPMANITLVAATDEGAGLYSAIDVARNLPGVSVVSFSWPVVETSGGTVNDAYFMTPASKSASNAGVTFVSASGDFRTPYYPATSPYVVGVGGTSLVLAASTNARVSETAWSQSGGGLSTVYGQPSYQANVPILAGTTSRAAPDVSFIGDPNTGVYVYDSVPRFHTTGPWWDVAGTSLGAPAWAGIFADADTLRSSEGLGTLDGFSQTLPALYSLPSIDFNDITTGSNGTYGAGPGYDLVTGLGSPVGNLLVPDLANYGTNPTPEPSSLALVFAAIVVAGGIRSASRNRKRWGRVDE